jgi:hypothetical protein
MHFDLTWKAYYCHHTTNLEEIERTDHRSVGYVPYDGTCPSGFKFSTWYMYSYFPGFIPGFNGAMLSVVGDVPVDSETPVVTS